MKNWNPYFTLRQHIGWAKDMHYVMFAMIMVLLAASARLQLDHAHQTWAAVMVLSASCLLGMLSYAVKRYGCPAGDGQVLYPLLLPSATRPWSMWFWINTLGSQGYIPAHTTIYGQETEMIDDALTAGEKEFLLECWRYPRTPIINDVSITSRIDQIQKKVNAAREAYASKG